ncbi:tetratricopeptide repeat protein [Actinomycetes bacterium KLBMP 9759]
MAGPAAAVAFGMVLRRRRTEALLTQEQLAEQAGLSVRTVRDLERGRVRFPRTGSLRMLAEVLGIDGDERAEFEALGRRDYWAERAASTAHEWSELLHPGRRAPAQLPADVAGFTGRAESVRTLDELLAVADPAAANIVVLSGAPGVGKTALAVHWAHGVRSRFPGGQLYLNLLGHSGGQPLSPMEALTRLLRGLDVVPERVPTDVAEASALLRSTLADTRTLLLLDDAGNADQVRPLLPGGPGCLVLVTSRSSLRGLVARNGAAQLTVQTMAPDDSSALLTRLLGPTEPGAVAELARLCGHLPLALRIAAANILGGDRDVAAFVERLRSGNRLAELAVPADTDAMVKAAFDLSYEALPGEVRRLFRAMAVAPGRDVTAATAGALLGRPAADAQGLLEQLAGAHLVEQPVTGRFEQADLLRLYAAERLASEDTEQERSAAWHRLLAHYLAALDAAARLLYSDVLRLPVDPPAAVSFADHREALAWIDAEMPALQTAVLRAADSGPARAAWQLADALHGYLQLRGSVLQWWLVASAGLGAAEAAGDPTGQAASHLSMARMYTRQDRYDDAVHHAELALALSSAAGWTECEAASHRVLGNIHRLSGDTEAAGVHLERALALADPADRAGAASIINNIATVNHELGRLEAAATRYSHVLELLDESGATTVISQVRTDLGDALNGLGRHDEALRHIEKALEVHRELADRAQEGYDLRTMAEAHRDAGRLRQALELAEQAVTIASDVDDVRLQGQARETVGTILLAEGKAEEAMPHFEAAMTMATACGNKYALAQAHIGMSGVYLERGAAVTAVASAETAVDIAERAGFLVPEGQGRIAAAVARLAAGQRKEAQAMAESAIATHAMTGYSRGRTQAEQALEAARNAAAAVGRHGTAWGTT